MIRNDGLNRDNFLLGCHAGTYGFASAPSNRKKILLLNSYFLIFLLRDCPARGGHLAAVTSRAPYTGPNN